MVPGKPVERLQVKWFSWQKSRPNVILFKYYLNAEDSSAEKGNRKPSLFETIKGEFLQPMGSVGIHGAKTSVGIVREMKTVRFKVKKERGNILFSQQKKDII